MHLFFRGRGPANEIRGAFHVFTAYLFRHLHQVKNLIVFVSLCGDLFVSAQHSLSTCEIQN